MNNSFFMRRALRLAWKGRANVFPNPMVGAVLVGSNGKIFAEAHHECFGGPHAEALVLDSAKRKKVDMRGAVLFINLEPCVGFSGKKTPACAPRIAKSGISQVVCAMNDPNPLVCGKGIRILKDAGVRVSVGVLAKEAEKLNDAYMKRMERNKPLVALKAAVTLDGKIATATGDSKWVTSAAARERVKALRDEFDAILVGIGTVKKDNPNLGGTNTQPLRVILDSTLSISPRAKVLRDQRVLLITTYRASKRKRAFFQELGYRIKIFPKTIKIPALLRFLRSEGVSRLLVEGGSEVFGSFLESKSTDRLYWFVAPKIVGGKTSLPAVGGRGVSFMKHAQQFSLESLERLGTDLLLTLSPGGRCE